MRPLLANQPNTRALGLAGLVVLIAIFVSPLTAQSPGDEPVETYEKVLFYPLAIPELDAEIPETGKLFVATASSLEASLASQATEVTIPTQQLQDVVSYVNRVMSTSARTRCNISPVAYGLTSSSGTGAGPQKIHLLDFLAAQDLVLLGEVEQIAPSWDFNYKRATAIVFVRIEEVLKDISGSFSKDQLVTYLRPWGEVEILGVSLCTDPPPDAPTDGTPHLGQHILLTGSKDLRNIDHLVTHHAGIFPVVEQMVTPPAGDPAYIDESATLNDVRERLQ